MLGGLRGSPYESAMPGWPITTDQFRMSVETALMVAWPSGFALRAAPCPDPSITSFTDPEKRSPRRAWLDYSGQFSAGRESGVAIFEHVTNPDYPNPLHTYPQCNCVMPAYPETREVSLAKDKPLVLKHRLWIHAGATNPEALASVWTSYAEPPQVEIVRE